MGLSGFGLLEDDFLDQLLAEPRPMKRMRESFESAVRAPYVAHDAGQAALVSAAVVDSVLCGTPLDDAYEVRAWLAALDVREAHGIRILAATACNRLLGPDSELNELWAENDEAFPRWHAELSGLIRRLTA
jgi:hypothetical protein